MMSLLDNRNTFINEDEFLRIKSLADQGDADAQNQLGIMYEKGIGVAQNYTEAWKWYTIALHKHADAADNRVNLAHVIPASQRAEVDKNIKNWFQNNFEDNKPVLEIRIKEIIEKHIKTLIRKHKLTVYEDDYGNVYYDKWDKEVEYFIEKVIRIDSIIRNLLRLSATGSFPEFCTNIINNSIRDYGTNQLGHDASVDINNLNSIEFEHYCADILRSSGWNVHVTQVSSDQGIDLIASYGNVKAVFQCKLYSQPVGNSAVQEIIAGKQFEQATIAAVVSNNSYTKSAKQLANATGVYILHYTELEQFAERVGLGKSNINQT